jgi:thioesterase domain-containing protein
MTKDEVKSYLYNNIPLAKAMDVEVIDISKDSLTLKAPLSSNCNMHGTAFGGSLSSIALLTGWSHIHTRLDGEWLTKGELVIAEANVIFSRPVDTDLVSRAYITPENFNEFVENYKLKGKAKVEVDIEVLTDNGPGCRMKGIYALIQS